MLSTSSLLRLACIAAGIAVSAPALADHRHNDNWRGRSNYHHYWHRAPRYYPSLGIYFNTLPGDFNVVVGGGSRYYYSGGVWYRPHGPRYVVVAPPLGVVVPALPPYFVTYPYGNVTYYVANDVYYVTNPQGTGYVVTSPPSAETAEAPPPEKVFVYPRNNQSQARQEKDRYECHAWAVSQTGFDPSAPQGGVEGDQVAPKRSEYKRANEACLDGRGYTVK